MSIAKRDLAGPYRDMQAGNLSGVNCFTRYDLLDIGIVCSEITSWLARRGPADPAILTMAAVRAATECFCNNAYNDGAAAACLHNRS